jgi:hypothetical protein
VTPSRGNGSVDSAAAKETVHRGVRWRRASSGRISWFNDGLGRWVAWSPGADAPPLPPGWRGDGDGETVPGGGGSSGPANAQTANAQPAKARKAKAETANAETAPTDAMARRPSMRSPYRLAPLLIVLFIVALAVWQATRPAAHASQADIAAAEALKGNCLAQDGGTAKSPVYSATPVSCSAGNASARVVAVLVPGTDRSVSCPEGSLVVQVLEPNVVGEPSECLLAVHR